MIRLQWESDEKLHRYDEVINRIKLPIEARFIELDNEIMVYIQSIYNVSGLPNVKKLNASYEMLNAIYSLYFTIMQIHLGSCNKYTLPVWNSRTQRFAPIGLRCPDMPIYPEYESDED